MRRPITSSWKEFIAKKTDAEYFPSARTGNWLEVKVEQWVKGVVGFAKLNETATTFSRLLIAIPDDKKGKKLKYIGAVGTGFTQKSYKEILSMQV